MIANGGLGETRKTTKPLPFPYPWLFVGEACANIFKIIGYKLEAPPGFKPKPDRPLPVRRLSEQHSIELRHVCGADCPSRPSSRTAGPQPRHQPRQRNLIEIHATKDFYTNASPTPTARCDI
jgi:hypothetical protein